MSSMWTPRSISGPPPAVARRVNQLPRVGNALATDPAGLRVVDRAQPAAVEQLLQGLDHAAAPVVERHVEHAAGCAPPPRPSARPAAALSASGFSDSTCTPASSAAMAIGACSVVGAAMLSTSRSAAASRSGQSAKRCSGGDRELLPQLGHPVGLAPGQGDQVDAGQVGVRGHVLLARPAEADHPGAQRAPGHAVSRAAAGNHRRRPGDDGRWVEADLRVGPRPTARRWPAPGGCRGGGRPGTPGRRARSRRPGPCPGASSSRSGTPPRRRRWTGRPARPGRGCRSTRRTSPARRSRSGAVRRGRSDGPGRRSRPARCRRSCARRASRSCPSAG